MSTASSRLLERLVALEPAPFQARAAQGFDARVGKWLTAGPSALSGQDRAELDLLCRQIDVKKKLPDAGHPSVISGLIAVLIANGSAGGADRGWRLKCINSALKALDLFADAPLRSELQDWAREALDAAVAEVGVDHAHD